uniref:Uncharacterized protein n=1 Tax=Steinernema glaseri TaxID=37863 RepID=A0A1I7XWR1_9BILA
MSPCLHYFCKLQGNSHHIVELLSDAEVQRSRVAKDVELRQDDRPGLGGLDALWRARRHRSRPFFARPSPYHHAAQSKKLCAGGVCAKPPLISRWDRTRTSLPIRSHATSLVLSPTTSSTLDLLTGHTRPGRSTAGARCLVTAALKRLLLDPRPPWRYRIPHMTILKCSALRGVFFKGLKGLESVCQGHV